MIAGLEKCPSDFLLEFASDKVSRNNLGDLYDLVILSLFAQNRKPIKVLELGVSLYGLGSGHAFSSMPFVEKFVGVDVVPLVSPFPEKGASCSCVKYSQNYTNLYISNYSIHCKIFI